MRWVSLFIRSKSQTLRSGGDIKPSIDVVEKIAEALEVSIDYLVGKTNVIADKQTLDRIESITKLPKEKQNYLFNLIDMCLRDFSINKSAL
ncbi:transcriptional regulator with XRE-family HTH domain [Chryseobacterium sp. SLBN-27]|nr:transcriptional regulator with XRE-family HTH domain [Chryseobacterium sp. SLBN-27]